MGRASSQGLTASDFHHQPYVNPLDVFPAKSRLANRAQNYRSPIRGQTASRSPSRFTAESHKFACCGEDEPPSLRPSSALSCCVAYDTPSDDLAGRPNTPNQHNEPLHNSPSPMDCEDCVDDCDDCVEEHQKFNEPSGGYLDDCEECIEEHAIVHDQHQGCTDTCDDCDFSCFDCIDWNEFEHDKSLGLSYSVPLLGDTAFNLPEPQLDENELLNFQPQSDMSNDAMTPPLDIPMHHQCFGTTIPYWTDMVQAQACNGSFGLGQQYPLPPFAPEFGCHPAAAHQQLAMPMYQADSTASIDFPNPTATPHSSSSAEAPSEPLNDTKALLTSISAPSTSRACQWLMPCGTVCGASFATTADLKKHLKALHLVKGVMKCSWQDCDSADFASEAALTGHISKKHLAPLSASSSGTKIDSTTNNDGTISTTTTTTMTNTEGPFKCTFPGCAKSFMYKQVRDEHVASCHNGNKMYCHICGQYLNGEGSNFKRHMATHRPKHQHTLCKFHGLGCKRRFPRVDNLRRHEACCKFGKRAALANASGSGSGVPSGTELKHHHHHHHLHV